LSRTFKSVSKFGLNTDDLGKMSMNYRRQQNLWHDGNIVVLEYLDERGGIKHLIQTTLENSSKHSERIAIEFLESH
jgi:hypothetical protein